MSENEKVKAPIGSMGPTCPACREDIPQFAFRRNTLGDGNMVNIYYCPNEKCRCLFAVQIMGQVPKATPEKSRILSLH